MTDDRDFNGAGEMILVDKPREWTSFDVVRKVRNLFDIKKIGHAGTLDPLATGLLILCTGPKTKELNVMLDKDKTYTGSFEIGSETASYDLETEVIERKPWSHVTEEMMQETIDGFRGEQEQIPPMYSALKHKGRALYKYARAGKSVDRPPRRVTVHEFTLTKMELPSTWFSLRCSKGTYVRSIIHDIGQTLETGAVLTSLRRETIGEWHIRDAYTVDQLIALRGDSDITRSSAHGTVVHS